MKRSEVVTALEGFFLSVYNITLEGDWVIDFLVESGMQPPPVRVLKEGTVLNQETGEWETGKISCTVNEWEPEE